MGGRGSQSIGTDAPDRKPGDTRNTYAKEPQLPPRIQATQGKAHTQRERERLADQESLHLLEAATAANSERAKHLDQESLAVLMDVTKRLETWQKCLNTPSEDWRYPALFRLKGVNSTPLSYSPSFSTPSNLSKSATPKSGNEFEQFLARGVAASEVAKAVAKKTQWDMLNAKLAGTGWFRSSIEANGTTESDHRRSQIDAVHRWFDKLEERDAEEEWERLEEDLIESVETSVRSLN